MATDFLNDQRRKLINLVKDTPIPKPEAVAAIALIDILDILLQIRDPLYIPKQD
jgi:hypothetical protein